ncbi:MAG TPA: phage portal protein, partial [Verrucomicrobiae bacterium]
APNQPTPSPSPPPIRGLAGRAGERRPLLCSADGFGGTRTYSGAQQGSPAQSRSDRAPAVPRRRLRQVLILDPARFQHIVEDHRLIGWRYTGFGPRAPLASQVFLPEEVWFERLPNPFDFWRGFPPLQAAEMAARTDYAAGLFMRGIIENNADTGVIVRTDKWLSDEQRTQILAALRDRKRGAGIADRPVLLLGSTEVIKPQLSSTDLQFLENRKFSRAEICAAFGVPEEVVTSTDHAKYDVMAGARLNFIENRVAPLCSRLEAAEDATVKSIDPAASGWFDLDSLPIMQESRRNRLAAARTGFDMGVPFNELNRVLDLGFKPLPWGDQGFVSGSLRKLGEGLKSEGRNPKSERNPKTEIRSEANESVFGVGCIPGESIEIERDQDDVFARAQWLLEQVEGAGLPKADPAALSKLRRFLFDQRGRMLEGLAAATKSGWAAASGGGSPGSEAPGVEQLIDSVFVLPRENAELARMLGPVFISADGPADPERDRAMDCIARFNEAVRDALHEAVRPACGGGELPSDLAARVKDFYNRHSSQIVAAAAVEFGRLLSLPQTKQQ